MQNQGKSQSFNGARGPLGTGRCASPRLEGPRPLRQLKEGVCGWFVGGTTLGEEGELRMTCWLGRGREIKEKFTIGCSLMNIWFYNSKILASIIPAPRNNMGSTWHVVEPASIRAVELSAPSSRCFSSWMKSQSFQLKCQAPVLGPFYLGISWIVHKQAQF